MTRDDGSIKSRYVEALFALSESKSLKKITVGDVVAMAGTARQTFYNNFRDINDLIVYAPIAFFEQHYQAFYTREGSQEAFRYVKAHRSFFSQLPSHEGQNCFKDTYLQWLKKSYYAIAFDGCIAPCDHVTRKALVDAYLFGVVEVFMDWCKGDMGAVSTAALISVIFDTKPSFIPADPPPDFQVAPLD